MAGVAFQPFAAGGFGVAAGQPLIMQWVTGLRPTWKYNFPISDNIQVTPLVQVIANPPIKTATARLSRVPCGRFSPSTCRKGGDQHLA